jgi:hypothetical protein
VSVVVAPDCPHRDLAVTRASQALNDAGFPTTVDVLVVTTPEEADVVGFGGSPTLLIDGRDPFPAPESTTWACRLYPTEEGLEGAPSLTQLQQALHR